MANKKLTIRAIEKAMRKHRDNPNERLAFLSAFQFDEVNAQLGKLGCPLMVQGQLYDDTHVPFIPFVLKGDGVKEAAVA